MQVLIAGCGDIGNILASMLLQEGHVVYGLRRNTNNLVEGVRAIRADLTDVETLADLPTKIDRLVYMPTPAARERSAYEAIFIKGWGNLWASLKGKPARSLLISSTAVFGQSDGSVVNESTPPAPGRFNADVLLMMEQLAAKCTENLVIVRFSGIYGPGRERLLNMAAEPGLEIQQSPPYFTNRIHSDDAASVLKHLLIKQESAGLYLASDDVPVPRYDVVNWLAQQQGCVAPKGLSVAQAGRGKRVDNQKLRRTGFRFSYPDYKAGYSAMLAQRKDHEFSN